MVAELKAKVFVIPIGVEARIGAPQVAISWY